jgi:hypothetical protein
MYLGCTLIASGVRFMASGFRLSARDWTLVVVSCMLSSHHSRMLLAGIQQGTPDWIPFNSGMTIEWRLASIVILANAGIQKLQTTHWIGLGFRQYDTKLEVIAD